MPSYKVIYFDGRGRGEIVRLMFTVAGQPFEDKRVTQEEWKEMKDKTPFGSLPVLEVDGKQYAQSQALGAYVAREFGFYGKNNVDALEIEQILGLKDDFTAAAIKGFYAKEEEKEEAMKNFLEVDAPKYFGLYDKSLKKNGTGYFVGNSLTFADVAVFDGLWEFNARVSGIFDSFQAVKEFFDKVSNNPKIKEYIAARKETPW